MVVALHVCTPSTLPTVHQEGTDIIDVLQHSLHHLCLKLTLKIADYVLSIDYPVTRRDLSFVCF